MANIKNQSDIKKEKIFMGIVLTLLFVIFFTGIIFVSKTLATNIMVNNISYYTTTYTKNIPRAGASDIDTINIPHATTYTYAALDIIQYDTYDTLNYPIYYQFWFRNKSKVMNRIIEILPNERRIVIPLRGEGYEFIDFGKFTF